MTPPRAGAGRPKGAPNKTTRDVREAIALLVGRNIGNLENWLNRVAEDDPARAATILLDAIEYHIPKLARSEITGKGGGKLEILVRQFVLPPPPRD